MITASSAVPRRTHWGEWVAWFAVLGIVTAGLLAIRARINEAHVALAYLIVVQAGSARRGRGLGISLAVASFLCFEVFFFPPYGTVAVGSLSARSAGSTWAISPCAASSAGVVGCHRSLP